MRGSNCRREREGQTSCRHSQTKANYNKSSILSNFLTATPICFLILSIFLSLSLFNLFTVRPTSIDISGVKHHTVQGNKVVLTCDVSMG